MTWEEISKELFEKRTAKRFAIQGVGISDHERKRLYDLKTVDGFISIRDLLNELAEENKELKNENKLLKDTLSSIVFDGKNVEIMTNGDVE